MLVLDFQSCFAFVPGRFPLSAGRLLRLQHLAKDRLAKHTPCAVIKSALHAQSKGVDPNIVIVKSLFQLKTIRLQEKEHFDCM